MYAPTTRARRILIAVLAFAMAAAFAFVASAAPADAARDEKTYSVTVVPDEANVGEAKSYTVTFTNETSNTVTQRAGAFSIDFGGAGFQSVTVNETATNPQSSTGQDWELVSTAGGNVVISATSGGERIPIGESVTVVVTATHNSPGLKTLDSAGDQEHHGDFNGGSKFDQPPKNGKPTINIVSVAIPCPGGCPIVDDDFTADLECGAQCAYLQNPVSGTTVADITVFEDGTIVFTLETTGKGPPPGSAFVEVDLNGDGDFNDPGEGPLPPCGTNGPPKCVHINRIHGNHTQYIVFYDGDPRFRFR
jgi:hypothetical protein